MNSFTDRQAFELIQKDFAKCMGIDAKDAPPVTFSALPEKSDFSMMVAKFAKTMKKNPVELAKEAAEKINATEGKEIIQSAFADKMYLNFKVDRSKIFELTYNTVIAMGDKYGSSTLPEPKTVVVEHTSANPNASLHIGNLRSVLIGAHLARLLKWVGYNVKELYFVNDLGAQIGLTAVGYARLKTLPEGYKIDHLIGTVYSIMNTLNSAQKLNIPFASLREHFPSYVPEQDNDDEDDKDKPKVEKSPEEEVIDTACRLHHLHPQLYDQLSSCFADDESISDVAAKLNQDYEAKKPEAVKIIRGMANATLTGIQQTLDTYNVHHDRFDYESEISWEGTSNALLKALKQSAFFHPETQCNEQGKPEGAYFDIDSYLKAIKAKQGKGSYQKPYPNFYLIR